MSTESLESSEIIDIIDIINQKPRRKEMDPHKTKADKPFRLLLRDDVGLVRKGGHWKAKLLCTFLISSEAELAERIGARWSASHA